MFYSGDTTFVVSVLLTPDFSSVFSGMEKYGKAVILIGLMIVAGGGIIWLFGDKLRFLGRLPGDIRYESGNTRVYIPITTMILVSVVVSLIFWLIQKLK